MKSTTLTRTLRLRSVRHLAFVKTLRCTVCRRSGPSDPHHLKYMQLRSKSRKSGDQWTIPLCRAHHDAVETAGDEQRWWIAQDIDPAPLAVELWGVSQARPSF
jgi:hypothetical protein